MTTIRRPALKNSHDEEYLEEFRQQLLSLALNLKQDATGRYFLKMYAHAFTEALTKEDLAPAVRKIYLEFLDATIDAITPDIGDKDILEALRAST